MSGPQESPPKLPDPSFRQALQFQFCLGVPHPLPGTADAQSPTIARHRITEDQVAKAAKRVRFNAKAIPLGSVREILMGRQ